MSIDVREVPYQEPAGVLARVRGEPGVAALLAPGAVTVACAPYRVVPVRAAAELAALDAALAEEALPAQIAPVAFPGGAIVAARYELGYPFVHLPAAPADAPLLTASFYGVVWAADPVHRRAWLCVRAGHDPASWRARLAAPLPPSKPAPAPLRLQPRWHRATYDAALQRIHGYIAAGDIYQANLTHALSGPCADPLALALRLHTEHPARFGAYLELGAETVVSNSPECFLQRQGDRVAMFPIKGTRARTGDDAERLAELSADPKERAEHVMIVDLVRSDLGRVCRPGTVAVPALLRPLTLPTLHHLESEVTGALRAGCGLGDLLRATFPCGSVTGAPKRRAMAILRELEARPRGFYTGAIGTVGPGGDTLLSVAIRTATVTGGVLRYGTGGGIVADSQAGAEYQETLLKARAWDPELA